MVNKNMEPQQALVRLSQILKTTEHVRLPYNLGAEVNECIIHLQTALIELKKLKEDTTKT
ncbi:hypothetical protein AWW68_19560 [Roseivirga spongicola]|uniref:Uncharacterized protein n=1 Tax=Roseivirga spongicola TaxID=333140 RepID=A0A150XCE9_9BACT|nr:hypothetical protein AWW68_19560 [Roseivirga spongicola]